MTGFENNKNKATVAFAGADSAISETDRTRLFDAAAHGDEITLQELIEQGMPINLQHPRTGATPLHYVAAIAGRPALRVLLKSGRCNFLLRDRDGVLASEVAMVDGEDPAIARLLRRKEVQQAHQENVELHRRPPSERILRAFFEAAAAGEDAAVKAYLKNGVPVNQRDPKTGGTALHQVAENAARDVLRVLLKTGQCNFLVKDNDGWLPSQLADIYGNDPAMARLLLRKEIEQARQKGIAPQYR